MNKQFGQERDLGICSKKPIQLVMWDMKLGCNSS